MEYANLNPNDRICQCRARLDNAKGDVICPVSDVLDMQVQKQALNFSSSTCFATWNELPKHDKVNE
jgi:uncharacterized protein (DUF2237 family)